MIVSARTSSIVPILSLMTLLSANAQQPAQQPVTSGPLVREGVTEKVSDHVYVIPDGSVPGVPNVGIIVGTKATLVIDTGLGRQNGETVLRETKKVSGNTALYLVTTHVHPEHDLGANAFPAATKMIRSKDQVDEIATAGMQTADNFRKRSPAMAQLLEGAEFRKADVTFDREHSLDLGGVKVRLIAMGPNHTPGDTLIVVEKEGVVFTGDLAMKALPAFASEKSSAQNWLKSLDKIDALKPSTIVPSHGPMGDAKYVADYRTFISQIQSHTAKAKREGKSVDEAVAIVTAELKAQYSESGRLAGAVRAAYREAT